MTRAIRWLIDHTRALSVVFMLTTPGALADDDSVIHEQVWAELSGRQARAIALATDELVKIVKVSRLGEFWVGVRSKPGDPVVIVSWNTNDRRQRDGGFVFEVNVETGQAKRRLP